MLDATGKAIQEAKVASEPEALVARLVRKTQVGRRLSRLDARALSIRRDGRHGRNYTCEQNSSGARTRPQRSPHNTKGAHSSERDQRGSAPTRSRRPDAERVRQVPLQWPGVIPRSRPVDCSATPFYSIKMAIFTPTTEVDPSCWLQIGGICWPTYVRPSSAGLPARTAGFGGCRPSRTRAALCRPGAPGHSRAAPRTYTSARTAGCVALPCMARCSAGARQVSR